MSKKKMIIKNCPCYVQYENSLHLCCDGQGDGECQDCTDCILKQIVDKCKIDIQNYSYYDKDYALGRTTEAKRILELLDIQEVK